jgi:eukaryotic-like serine/threonine-protein kinase
VSITECLASALLERFLLGLVPEADATPQEKHLASCPRCLARICTLQAEDQLVQTMKHLDEPSPPPFPGLMRSLVPLLKCLRIRDRTETLAFPDDAPVTPFTFSFLGPSSEPGDLGRLGPYRILEVLGAGGMGMVFRAHDERLRRDLAVKVIKPDLGGRPQVVELFLQEARAAAAVEHENIVTVYQADVEKGIPYLAMPLLRGESLEARLGRAGGPLSIDDVLHIARETANGLAAAHEHGLVHRDIKPGNLWLEYPREAGPDVSLSVCRVKILDFGLAQTHGTGDEGTIAGTPAYMAPEQAQGYPLDGRADLFSLGCILYRAATGKPAFTGNNVYDLLIKMATEGPPPVRTVNPAVPEDLAGLIERLLARNREERFPSAGAVVAAVEAIEKKRREAARSWLSRRGWLVAAIVGVAAGIGLWAWFGVKKIIPPDTRPGEVTFDYDEPEARLVLLSGEEKWFLDPRKGKTLSLPPGDYLVRPEAETKRRLSPDNRFTVRPAEPLTVKLALVGERAAHNLHQGSVSAVALVEAGGKLRAFSAGLDRRVCLWEPLTHGEAEFVTPRFRPGTNDLPFPPLRTLAVSPDGTRVAFGGGDVTGAQQNSIFLWDFARRAPVKGVQAGTPGLITAMAFDPSGKLLVTTTSEGLAIPLQAKDGKLLQGFPLKPEESRRLGIDGLAVSPAGDQVLLACGDGSIRTVTIPVMFARVTRNGAHPGGAVAVAYLPEGKGLVSAGQDGVIRVWDDRAGKSRDLTGHKGSVRCLAVDPRGSRILSGGDDGTLRLWDVASGKQLLVFEQAHKGGVNGVALTRDGRRALSGGADRAVRFWQLPH